MMLLSICLPDILWRLNDVFAGKLTILGTNTRVLEMELYIILSTLEKCEY